MTQTTDTDVEVKHPGYELGAVLAERGIADSTLADQGGLSRPLISQITNGNRRITSTSATKICRVIGGDPLDWVRKQRAYDTYVEFKKVRAKQAELAGASSGR